MARRSEDWVAGARRVASPNCDSRPAGVEVTLVVLHSISLPRGDYGGDAVERLFTNHLDTAAHPSFADLAGVKVSAHFLIRRDGELIQFVPVSRRAWHAGASRWRGRERCNDFSLGIELEGVDDQPFERAQYARLTSLLKALREIVPLRDVAAHSDVAPGRKTDTGAGFDWRRFASALSR
jgi:N-acetyl-anhydromuramoyl-L-alanine amidase